MIIKDIDHLKKLSKDGLDCHIRLNFNFRSSKHIYYNEDTNIFEIINYIDDSEQSLTEEQIFDKDYTNIGEALKHNALYID
jgi:uncharacterized protein YaaR (DUF327 family)